MVSSQGYLIGKAVPPALLEGMAISDGDSAATLAGSGICLRGIHRVDQRRRLKYKIQPLILASQQIGKTEPSRSPRLSAVQENRLY